MLLGEIQTTLFSFKTKPKKWVYGRVVNQTSAINQTNILTLNRISVLSLSRSLTMFTPSEKKNFRLSFSLSLWIEHVYQMQTGGKAEGTRAYTTTSSQEIAKRERSKRRTYTFWIRVRALYPRAHLVLHRHRRHRRVSDRLVTDRTPAIGSKGLVSCGGNASGDGAMEGGREGGRKWKRAPAPLHNSTSTARSRDETRAGLGEESRRNREIYSRTLGYV